MMSSARRVVWNWRVTVLCGARIYFLSLMPGIDCGMLVLVRYFCHDSIFPEMHMVITIVICVIAAIVLFFPVTILLTSLWESQPAKHPFVPLTDVMGLERSPYLDAVVQQARDAGFMHAGDFAVNKSTSMYKVISSMWVSDDCLTLCIITGGTIAGIACRRTNFLSRLRDHRVLSTQDEFGELEFSGLTASKVVMNGDFPELYAIHRPRLSPYLSDLQSFSPSDAIGGYEEIERHRLSRLIQRGLARFADPSQTTWKYTLKGAFKNITSGSLKQTGRARKQIDRLDHKRPGDDGYVPSTANQSDHGDTTLMDDERQPSIATESPATAVVSVPPDPIAADVPAPALQPIEAEHAGDAGVDHAAAAAIRSGANWFFWIAGMSVINSVASLGGADWGFVIGLGITQVFDAVALAIESNVVKAVVFGIDLICAGIFISFGVIAGKGRRWCFLLGMCLYGLDSVIFIVAEDALGFGFHFMALYFINQGYRASRNAVASRIVPTERQPAADA